MSDYQTFRDFPIFVHSLQMKLYKAHTIHKSDSTNRKYQGVLAGDVFYEKMSFSAEDVKMSLSAEDVIYEKNVIFCGKCFLRERKCNLSHGIKKNIINEQ